MVKLQTVCGCMMPYSEVLEFSFKYHNWGLNCKDLGITLTPELPSVLLDTGKVCRMHRDCLCTSVLLCRHILAVKPSCKHKFRFQQIFVIKQNKWHKEVQYLLSTIFI
jgi:hypothetical protein